MTNVCSCNLRVAILRSTNFASHTVQVTTNANARPNTACTRTSADMNMDHGERPRRREGAGLCALTSDSHLHANFMVKGH